MARTEFSFDIVSQVSMPEVANAVDQARREIATRYDFKDTGTSISQDETLIEVRSSTEDRLRAAVEVFKEKAVRRRISLKALHFGPVQPAAKGTYKQVLHVNVGIDRDHARELVRFIKKTGLKVQAQVQEDQVRVSSKSKDELQELMRRIGEQDFGIALQFVNLRP